MKFNNNQNYIYAFNEILKERGNGSFFNACIKKFNEECEQYCYKCDFNVVVSNNMTDKEKIKFVIDILKKNLTYPNDCGTCLISPCKKETSCTRYIIDKYKIKL